jgi:hypothetical protein
MKYQIRYWFEDLSSLTKLKENQIITAARLIKLLESNIVDIMILRHKDENISTCALSLMGFKQR